MIVNQRAQSMVTRNCVESDLSGLVTSSPDPTANNNYKRSFKKWFKVNSRRPATGVSKASEHALSMIDRADPIEDKVHQVFTRNV